MKNAPNKHKNGLSQAMSACVENGNRLREDAEWLGTERPSSVALCILAQEEFAKAFLLYLVCEGIVPWTAKVRKSLRNHKHKHLLGVIMDWLSPSDDEFFASIGRRPEHVTLPAHVADAMKIYVENTQPRGHITCPPAPIDPVAKGIVQGDRDRRKQDALYVRTSEDGNVINVPTQVKPEMAEVELDRTRRLGDLVEPLRKGSLGPVLNYHLVVEAMSFLLLEKRSRPFLVLKESEFGGQTVAPTGVTWPHSITVLIENISDEPATVVSGHATLFIDKEVVRPSFLFNQFAVDPYATNICTFFVSEETYTQGTSAPYELNLYVNLKYQGCVLEHKYCARMWSAYDPAKETFRETLTDLKELMNGKSRPQAQTETKWSRPTTT